jgi:hypothetical protein
MPQRHLSQDYDKSITKREKMGDFVGVASEVPLVILASSDVHLT